MIFSKRVLLLLLLLLMLKTEVGGRPSVENGECHVKEELLTTAAPGYALNVSLLAYVSRWENLMLGFFFPDLSEKERDAVNLTSIGATHVELQDGQRHEKSIVMSRLIPEGWSILRVTEAGGNVTVTLVLGEDHLTLFTLPALRTTPSYMRADGIVTLCSQVTPTWDVGPNDEVVYLQPVWNNGHNQWIEVTREVWGGATLDVTFPFTPSSNRSNIIPVSENTTFKISGRARGSHVHYQVFKVIENGGSGGEEEEVEMVSYNMTVSTHTPRLVVSGGGGGHGSSTNTRILLSLSLSSPQENITTSGYSTGFIVMVIIVVIVLVVVVVLIRGTCKDKGECLPCCIMKKEQRSIKNNKAVEQVDAGNLNHDCVYGLLPTVQVIDESSSSSFLLGNGRSMLSDARVQSGVQVMSEGRPMSK